MCGSAAVPTIRQNTSARKLRRETSRAASSLPGNASACRSGGPRARRGPASLVHAPWRPRRPSDTPRAPSRRRAICSRRRVVGLQPCRPSPCSVALPASYDLPAVLRGSRSRVGRALLKMSRTCDLLRVLDELLLARRHLLEHLAVDELRQRDAGAASPTARPPGSCRR